MQFEVTRDLIKDLWPLYLSKEISDEGKDLVEEYLSQDLEFASILRATRAINPVIPDFELLPDQERRLLDQAREQARMRLMVIGGAVGVAGLIAVAALIAVIILMFTQTS